MIKLLPWFLGVDREYLYLHLKEFEAIYGTSQEPNCNMDIVRLKLWFYGLKPRSYLYLAWNVKKNYESIFPFSTDNDS